MITRVLVYDDNLNRRESLKLLIDMQENMACAGIFNDCRNVLEDMEVYQPDVILMDIDMPHLNGIEGVKLIRKHNEEIFVIMQTVFDDDHRVFAAICAGANGYVLKNPDPEVMLQAILDVHSGGAWMTPRIAAKVLRMLPHQFVRSQPNYVSLPDREREILGCMVKGMSYKMIADACTLSFHTVHWHVKHIYEKLHVNSAPEAVAKAIEGRLI